MKKVYQGVAHVAVPTKHKEPIFLKEVAKWIEHYQERHMEVEVQYHHTNKQFSALILPYNLKD